MTEQERRECREFWAGYFGTLYSVHIAALVDELTEAKRALAAYDEQIRIPREAYLVSLIPKTES